MGREGAGTPRRMTRSNFSEPKTPTKKTSSESHQTNALPISPLSITLDDLYTSLPGRMSQVKEILQSLGPLDSPMLPLFLYGGTSTGKTRTIVQIFRHLNRPFVYVSCRSCQTPRILFQSVLDQLASHTRNSGNGYSSLKRCDRASEFVELLRDAVFSWQLDVVEKERGKKLSSVGGVVRKEGNGRMIYLIVDNVEVIRHWGKNSELLSLLFKIHDITRMTDLGLIYISSNAGPEIYYSSASSTEPVPIFFPDYAEEELHQILIRKQENPKLYSSFLKVVLKLFFRVTRRVDELSLVFKPLFQKYCEPLTDLSVVPDESLKRGLFYHLQPHIVFSLDEIFMVTPRFSADAAAETSEKSIARQRNARKLVCEGLDFHMSVSAKYLLISAFLASRNPATLDASMFDTKGDSGKQKRKRKNSETTLQQKDTKAQEMLMKGPGSFSLERLLAIFQCIASVSDICVDDEDVVGGDEEVGLMSDALLQLSTLCDANLITKGGSCPLECSTRYRSSIDEDMVSKVARTINFPLSKYLFRR